MKIAAFVILTFVGAVLSHAADPAVGRLPDGSFYILNEVDFCLKENAARQLSSVGVQRQRVNVQRMNSLHSAFQSVVGTHLTAKNWLNGEPLPSRLARANGEVPEIARSLKAILRPGQDAAAVVQQLRMHPDIQWVSLNRLYRTVSVPNDALWSSQWGTRRIQADLAWDVAQASTGVRVAIVDTGVDFTHPDLASRIVYDKGFAGNSNGDAHRDVRGGTSIDHGTHVAGIALAVRNNSIGIAGVATAGIMAMGCGVWNNAASEYFIGSAASAINDAVANGADVVNCSFAMPAPLDSSVRSALDNARDNGVVVVCSAGNENLDVASSLSAGWIEHSWPIIVSSINQNDSKSGFSNFGNAIDLAAPGESIISTATTNYLGAAANGQYRVFDGTSMAAPQVAGGAAMVDGMNPNLIDGAGTKDLLYRMAQDLGAPGKDTIYGYGVLRLDPSFLSALKNADAFVGNSGSTTNGSYQTPYSTIADALVHIPSGGTLVLNAGVSGPSTYNYAAQIISTPCTLTAFPDRLVTIGQ